MKKTKDLFANIKEMSKVVDSVIVLFSRGKDSIATLDLCCNAISNVTACYMSMMGKIELEYQQRFLEFYEKKFNIKIHKYPLYDVSKVFRKNSFTGINLDKYNIPNLSQTDIENKMRLDLGIEWTAWGYKKTDGLGRGGILRHPDVYFGIDKTPKRIYPVADWNEQDVFNYLKVKKLPLPIEYQYGKRNIDYFSGEALCWIKDKFPKDYKRILDVYPFLEAEVFRIEN